MSIIPETKTATENPAAKAGPPAVFPPPWFGGAISSIASSFGLRGEDAAVALAAVLGNIAGPAAGIKDHRGRRCMAGINTLWVAPLIPQARALEDFLVQALRTMQERIRSHTRAMCRSVVNGETWGYQKRSECPHEGFHTETDLWGHHLAMQKDTRSFVQSGEVPLRGDLELRGFNVCGEGHHLAGRRLSMFILPSFFLEGVEAGQIPKALLESHNRYPFVFDSAGSLGEGLVGTGQEHEAARQVFCRLLAGEDLPYALYHPEQGYGILERSQIRVWMRLREAHLMKLLANENAIPGFLERCLCVEPRSQKWSPPGPGGHSWAWKHYHGLVGDIMGARQGARGPVMELQPEDQGAFARRQEEYLEWLAGCCAMSPCRLDLAEFHDLPARLLWAFLQLRAKGEGAWPIPACFHTARHCVSEHQRILHGAIDRSRERQRSKALSAICGILERKGPCKMRDLLRIMSTQRKSDLMPVLDWLVQQRRILCDEHHRYALCSGAN